MSFLDTVSVFLLTCYTFDCAKCREGKAELPAEDLTG